MSGGKRRAGMPVGKGYMPKGGVAAARLHNEGWREVDEARRAAEAAAAARAASAECVEVPAGVQVRGSAPEAPVAATTPHGALSSQAVALVAAALGGGALTVLVEYLAGR